MSYIRIALIVLAAAIAVFLFFFARSLRRGGTPSPEALLLEEATVTEPIAPGLEGRAELRKRGSPTVVLRVRATDSSQAFARGSMVRVIDMREGCCIVESSDQVHLVR